MKSKGDELDVDKLVSAPVELTKLRDVVKNDVVYNVKINDIEDKTSWLTYLLILLLVLK